MGKANGSRGKGNESIVGDDLDFPVRNYLREIGQYRLLTLEEEQTLGKQILKKSKGAKEKMILGNLRLVVKIAKDYTDYGLPLSDLISEGNIGLVKAAAKYKPGKAKFSTYAAWWIKQAIKLALSNKSRVVRLPVHIGISARRISEVDKELFVEKEREPYADEIAAVLGVSPKKVRWIVGLKHGTASIQAPIDGSSSDATFAELLTDESVGPPDENVSRREQLERLQAVLSKLQDRERRIIIARFGLNGKREQTLEVVSRQFGVTRERVRQIQNLVFKKMRKLMEDRPRCE